MFVIQNDDVVNVVVADESKIKGNNVHKTLQKSSIVILYGKCKKLRNIFCEQCQDQIRRIPAWRSTSAGMWTGRLR